MSYSSDDAVKERIREATDIVELVQRYRPTIRSGRKYKALCPFHDDSRPSLSIDPERQYYKCFVCQESGDVFSFLMKMENVGFREALTILAERTGIPLPKKREKKIILNADAPEDEPPQEIDKKTLLETVDWLAKQYHQALLALGEAEVARKYLQDRKISAESIEKFQVGYAPTERDWIVRKVDNSKQLQILEIVGNLRKSEYGSGHYDFFGGRLMFPISDDQGRPIAFGGRVIPGTPLAEKAKYYNTWDQSPLYVKHRILYGFDIAKQKMRTTRRALVMEGYTDVIAAHQFGFEDAVAACGTAVGPEQIRKLKSHADKILLVFDGDDAGVKRAMGVLDHFVAEGVDMAVVTLPDGRDPADFLEQFGAEGFQAVLESEAVDALDYAIRVKTRGINLDHDVIASSRALNELLAVIAKAPFSEQKLDDPRIRIEKTLQILSQKFGVPEDTVRKRFNENRRRGNEYRNENEYDHPDEYDERRHFQENLPDILEREMLELWLLDPTVLYDFWEPVPPERCRSPITRQIYEKCNEIIERGKPATFDRLIVAFDDPWMKRFLDELLETALKKSAIHEPPIIAGADGTDEEEPPVVQDKVGEIEESLRSRENEQKLPTETREQMIREILDGFDQRDRSRRRIKEVDQLRGDGLTEEDKDLKLLQMVAEIQRQQEEKKRKLGISDE